MQNPQAPTAGSRPSGTYTLSCTHEISVAGRQARCPGPASSPAAANSHGRTHRTCTTWKPSVERRRARKRCDIGDVSLHQSVAVPPLKNMTVPRGVPEGSDTASSPPAFWDTFAQFEMPNRWHREPGGQSLTPPDRRVNVPSGHGWVALALADRPGTDIATVRPSNARERATRGIEVQAILGSRHHERPPCSGRPASKGDPV